jgi:hypothetical protein
MDTQASSNELSLLQAFLYFRIGVARRFGSSLRRRGLVLDQAV